MRRRLLFALTIFIYSSLGAQSFQIMQYGIEDGLPHNEISSIIQGTNSFIWISTSQGITRFDGLNFETNFQGDTLPSTTATCSFLDSQGRIWFGHPDGLITRFDSDGAKILLKGQENISFIVGFGEDAEGNILAMTQRSGLIVFSPADEITQVSEAFIGNNVSSFFITPNGDLLIGGFVGLDLYKKSADNWEYENSGRIAGMPFAQVFQIIKDKKNDCYWVGTDESGLYCLTSDGDSLKNYRARKIGSDQGLNYAIIKSLLLDDDGMLWISDWGKGVYRLEIDSNANISSKLLITPEGGLQEQFIVDILQDTEGNMWFASFSEGVSVLRDQAFTFYELAYGEDVPEISAINMKGEEFWFGSREGTIVRTSLAGRDDLTEYEISDVAGNDEITALWQDDNNNVYIGTESSGVFIINRESRKLKRFFYALSRLGNNINAITGDAQYLYIACNDGVYILDYNGNEIEHRTTRNGLPHNVVNDVLVDNNNKVWVATRGSGLYSISNKDRTGDRILDGEPKLEFLSLCLDHEDNIWAASAENGVFMFGKDTVAVYSTDQGLKAKYTYAVAVDEHDLIWVGHRLGLSRINPATGNVAVFDADMGFTSDILPRSIAVNDYGSVIFGTNEGLIVYDTHRARQDTIAPILSLSKLTIADSVYNISSEIKLPYGSYKVRIDFVGINLSNPEQVQYRWKMDGVDDWSHPTRETYARYQLEDGNYTFMLSACDGNGNCTGEVRMISIKVKIPIWKSPWFIVGIVLLAVGSVFGVFKVRERNQKALQEYLEKQLAERTREVINQKEEIEIKNRDITDSINYAQRIQASILPPIQRLNNTFEGSFVFYQPRDIVSGDFYWYDKLDEERFLIVCADSTGHGVPGAFMSMIGTTLIKDICLRTDVSTPADVLSTLDNEVRDALNQNQETDGSNDGMDIIVAEINLKTNKFIVSSAMRPVILYKGNEQIYVKGSRSSVGGQLDDTAIEKEFINEEFQLSKGDIIYMFSDGYPDQFGGPLGRKFKMVRLKNLLRDIHDKPMEEQYNYVKSNFFLWKEDLEQVDDVLFMGIKL